MLSFQKHSTKSKKNSAYISFCLPAEINLHTFCFTIAMPCPHLQRGVSSSDTDEEWPKLNANIFIIWLGCTDWLEKLGIWGLRFWREVEKVILGQSHYKFNNLIINLTLFWAGTIKLTYPQSNSLKSPCKWICIFILEKLRQRWALVVMGALLQYCDITAFSFFTAIQNTAL